MAYVSIDLLAYDANANTASSGLFGYDVTGFRSNNSYFFDIAGPLESSFIRWPGQLIADAISVNYNESNYDLANQFVMDRGSKDNLKDIFEDVAATGQGLVMLAPTERFLDFDPISRTFSADADSARLSVRDFLLSLAKGDRFGEGVAYEIPEKFILQLGQEYYVTKFFADFDPSLSDQVGGQIWDSYVEAISELYGEMAAEITSTEAYINSHPNDFFHSDLSVDVAVQMGRFHVLSRPGNPYWGNSTDIAKIISGVGEDGLASIDYLLWQRYVPSFGGITNGYSRSSTDLTLADTVAIWDAAADREFQTLVGTSIASVTRNEVRPLFGGTVSDDEFQFTSRQNRAFEEFYQEKIDLGAGGVALPAAIVELFTELVGSGVDLATAFTGDNVTPEAQSGRLTAVYFDSPASTSGQNVLLAGGQMYQELSQTIDGMSVAYGFGLLEDDDDSANVNIFRDADTIAIFASSTRLQAGPVTVTIDLGEYGYDYQSIMAETFNRQVYEDWQEHFRIVDLESRWSGFDQSAEAAIYSTLVSQGLTFDISVSGQLTFELGTSWQVAKIVIELGLLGSSGTDTLVGKQGGDTIKGFGGNDQLRGASGDDRLYGGAGDDTLWGGDGADLIDGGSGNDTASYATAVSKVQVSLTDVSLNGGDAMGDILQNIENLLGSKFNDVLYGSDGKNLLVGFNGNDRIQGRGGDDTLQGQRGEDRLFGEGGADLLYGGAGNDKLDGGGGDDMLFGGHGDDSLFGGFGSDVLYGGLGADEMFGGAGADSFIFDFRDIGSEASGYDIIADFEIGSDRILIRETQTFTVDDFLVSAGPGVDTILLSVSGTSKGILISSTLSVGAFDQVLDEILFSY